MVARVTHGVLARVAGPERRGRYGGAGVQGPWHLKGPRRELRGAPFNRGTRRACWPCPKPPTAGGTRDKYAKKR